MAADLAFQHAAALPGEIPLHEREVGLCHRPPGKLPREMRVRVKSVLGHDQAAAGVLVQPVDDARALLPADPRKGGPAMLQQGIDERVLRGLPAPGCTTSPGRLVEHEQIGVFEEDVQRDFLRLQQRGLDGRLRDGDNARPGAAWSLDLAGAPFSVTWPSFISPCRRERERWGNCAAR